MTIKSNHKLTVVLVVLLVTLCSGHAFQAVYSISSKLIIPATAIFMLFELLQFKNTRLSERQKALLLLFFMIAFTCLAHLGQSAGYYFILACYIFVGYSVAKMYSLRQIAACHVKIMTVVTVVSIIGYILVQNTTLLNQLPKEISANNVEYRIAGIFNFLPNTPERNCGMFWEPGLFATHIIIAMIFEIMYNEKANLFRMVIFTIGIITANSAAGFALLFFCFILSVVKKAERTKNRGMTAFAIVAFFIGVLVVLNFDFLLERTFLGENEFLQKLSSDRVANSSRIDAFYHNFRVFMIQPLFGVGAAGVSSLMRNVADTSTSTYLMSVFGFLAIMYTVYWVRGIFNVPKISSLIKILLTLIVLIILNKEPHHQNVFSWTVMFALMSEDNLVKTPIDT